MSDLQKRHITGISCNKPLAVGKNKETELYSSVLIKASVDQKEYLRFPWQLLALYVIHWFIDE